LTEPTESRTDIEQLVAWLRLRRLTSTRLCRRIISLGLGPLSEEVLKSKAEGLAWAVRSALGYWESSPADLNARILTRYYALLQISIAEQVAWDAEHNLTDIQRHTERGHGLSTVIQPDAAFPNCYYVALLKTGHFYSYSGYKKVDLSSYAFDKRPREWSKLSGAEQERLVSLADLFRRIPELRPVVAECLDAQPLSFHVGYASRNLEVRSQRLREKVFAGKAQEPIATGLDDTTYIAIYTDGNHVTQDYLNTQPLPIQNIVPTHDAATKTDYFIGTISHPKGYWWQYLNTYKSGYCPTSLIVPVWGTIADVFMIHFSILYALSIIVRYLPSLWHEIEDGELDHIRALIEHYLVIVDNVLPRTSVERITGSRLSIVSPGSMHGTV
jgi:hypothetical protein